MNINEDTVLNNQVLPFLNTIIEARKQLKELGVIRSEKDVLGDYGEWLASKGYNLTLSNSGVNKTFDAVDSEGKTYQIKSRRVGSLSETTSFDFYNYDEFDYLIAVFIHRDTLIPLIKPLKIPYAFVTQHWLQNASRRSFRWNKTTKQLLSGLIQE